MSQRVFVSYSHRQGEWVTDHLVPVLKAAGIEVFFDRERFTLGRSVVGQMDATQDLATRHLLVLSPDYLASEMCRHEMSRAVARDPDFSVGSVIPIRRAPCELPEQMLRPEPLFVDLLEGEDRDPESWERVLAACRGALGCSAPDWLEARNDLRVFLEGGQSVSLVISGKVSWMALVEDLRRWGRGRPSRVFDNLCEIDLNGPSTQTEAGLVDEIFRALGTDHRTTKGSTGRPPLADLEHYLKTLRVPPRVALLHFDRAKRFDGDFFGAVRYLIEQRLVVCLFQSRRPFMSIVPPDDLISEIDVKTVELLGS